MKRAFLLGCFALLVSGIVCAYDTTPFQLGIWPSHYQIVPEEINVSGLKINLPAIAQAVGYPVVYSVETKEYLQELLAKIKDQEGPVFLEVKVKKGNRKDLGRPTTTPIQNKEALMDFLKK